jgi:iron(III) transport system permease protein
VRGRVVSIIAGGTAVATAMLALAPLAALIVMAVGDSGDVWSHLARYVFPVALVHTALLLAGVGALAIGLGAGTAWMVTTFTFPGRDALIWLLPLPLAIPTYIVAYVYVDLLDAVGPVQALLRSIFDWRSGTCYWCPDVRSLGGAVVLFSFVLYPYVYLAARAMFQTQGAQFAEAARILGARPWQLARRISLPLARPAIAVGVALALIDALNDIGACEYLGVQTLTLSIFTTWLNRGSLAGASQIACFLLLVVAVLIGLEHYGRRGREFAALRQEPMPPARIRLDGASKWAAAGLCFLPVLLGFLLPAGFLLHETVTRGFVVGFDPALLAHGLTTVSLASAATAIVLLLGCLAVVALRMLKHPVITACVNVAGIGYAVPGTVLALGLLSPLVLADEAINGLASGLGGKSTGLLLAGSSAAVVIAYVIRFMAIATGLTQAGFARISTDLDEVARLLGAGPARVARTVYLPLARPAIFGAGLMVFVECLKELPATLLLRPLNSETLAIYIYQFASRGSFEEGALAALIIVAVGILPVIRITRYADIASLSGRVAPAGP